jgi:hypothetical protein
MPATVGKRPRISCASFPDFPNFPAATHPQGIPGPRLWHATPFGVQFTATFVVARLDHLTGDIGTEDHVMALATRLAIVVSEFVAAGHALQKALVADPALAAKNFRRFQCVVSRLHVIFGCPFFVRLPFLAHGLFSQEDAASGPIPSPFTISTKSPTS